MIVFIVLLSFPFIPLARTSKQFGLLLTQILSAFSDGFSNGNFDFMMIRSISTICGGGGSTLEVSNFLKNR